MKVEVWSDVVCPWCYVGKRHLDAALEAFDGRDEVEVIYRSFELDPNGPRRREGDYASRLAKKYGSDLHGAQQMIDRMTGVAASVGIEMRLDIAQLGNTFDAHRVLHLAKEHGRQREVKERLFQGVFTDGEQIGDPHVVARLAVEAGLPENEVVEVLSGTRFGLEVREDEAEAMELGVRGVPFMVVDRRIAVSGAQPPEVILDAFRRVAPAA